MSLVTLYPGKHLQTFDGIKDVNISYENHTFYVVDSKGLKTPIQRAFLDQKLRNISNIALEKMKDVGYFSLRKLGDDYTMKFCVKLNGGGPFGSLTAFVGTWTAGLIMFGAGTALTVTGVGVLLQVFL